MSTFKVPQESIAGLPTIEFEFTREVGRASLAGAVLTMTAIDDDSADLVIHDASGVCLAHVTVHKVAEDTNITESVTRIGSALLWSHARYVEAKASQGGK